MGEGPPPPSATPWWQQAFWQRLGVKLLGGALLAAATTVEQPFVRLMLRELGNELTEQADSLKGGPSDDEVKRAQMAYYQEASLPNCPDPVRGRATVWLTSGAVCSCQLDGGWVDARDGGACP